MTWAPVLMAAWFAASSAWSRRRLRRCAVCEPKCPNGHRIQIAANEGVILASTSIGLLTLATYALGHLIGE